MDKIKLRTIKCYAHHGCMPEETLIGSEYIVNLSVTADLSKSCKSDELEDTVDYVALHHIVKEEMDVPSKLLEHVAQRIIDRIFKSLPEIKKATVQVEKLNPPIGGNVSGVSVRLKKMK